MKKLIAMTALVSIIGLTGVYQASAYMGLSGGNGCNKQPFGMAATAQMDEATKVKFDAFFKDTRELRKAVVIKRAEKNALLRSEEPNAEKIGKLAGELFDLHTSMREKAEAAGLGEYIGRRGGCSKSCGPKMGHGQRAMLKAQGATNVPEPANK